MSGGRDAAIVVLLGAGAWYLTKRNPSTGLSLADEILGASAGGPRLAFTPTGASAPGATATSSGPSGSQKTLAYVGTAATAAAAILPAIGIGGAAGGASAGGAAAGAGAGIGLGAALAATGIAAGAAILAWGIIQKGWFRGGEEALKVSPARDEYLQEFNRQYGFPPQDPQLGDGAGFAKACGAAQMPGYEADRMLRRLHAADKVAEWQAATADVDQTFKAYSDALAAPTLPEWRQRQLRGEVIFASGLNAQQLIVQAQALGSGYADLATAYARGF